MFKTSFKTALAVAGLFIAGGPSTALAVNLVTNGDFEMNHGLGGFPSPNATPMGWNIAASDPTANGVIFAFIINADSDSVPFTTPFGVIRLWGPDTPTGTSSDNKPIYPVANGYTGSPNGGDFLGMDADYARATISQMIMGLTPGHTYSLSFDWAESQIAGYTGTTYTGWNVGFGSSTATTGTPMLSSTGFSGWMNYSTTFVATSASQLLSFASTSVNSVGEPPFALLDSVSLTDTTSNPVSPTPEPANWAMILIGLAGMGAVARRRRAALAS